MGWGGLGWAGVGWVGEGNMAMRVRVEAPPCVGTPCICLFSSSTCNAHAHGLKPWHAQSVAPQPRSVSSRPVANSVVVVFPRCGCAWQVMASMQKMQQKRKSDAMQRVEREAICELEEAAAAARQRALRSVPVRQRSACVRKQGLCFSGLLRDVVQGGGGARAAWRHCAPPR